MVNERNKGKKQQRVLQEAQQQAQRHAQAKHPTAERPPRDRTQFTQPSSSSNPANTLKRIIRGPRNQAQREALSARQDRVDDKEGAASETRQLETLRQPVGLLTRAGPGITLQTQHKRILSSPFLTSSRPSHADSTIHAELAATAPTDGKSASSDLPLSARIIPCTRWHATQVNPRPGPRSSSSASSPEWPAKKARVVPDTSYLDSTAPAVPMTSADGDAQDAVVAEFSTLEQEESRGSTRGEDSYQVAPSKPPSLPVEIWDEILKFASVEDGYPFGNRETLCIISRTSSYLRSRAQPILFKVITISPSARSLPNLIHRLKGLQMLLAKRPEAATWTTAFTVRGVSARSVDVPGCSEVLTCVAGLFAQMRALKVVHFDGYNPPNTVVLHMKKLQLDSLSIRHSETLNLDFNACTAPSVRSLHLSDGAMSIAYKVQQQNPRHVMTNLQTLTLETPTQNFELPWFVSLLAICPGLDDLRIVDHMRFEDNPGELTGTPPCTFPPDTVAALTKYSGPIHLARALIPGRPVAEVDVSFSNAGPLVEDDLGFISQSSSKIIHIRFYDVSWGLNLPPTVCALLPDLRTLEINSREDIPMVSPNL